MIVEFLSLSSRKRPQALARAKRLTQNETSIRRIPVLGIEPFGERHTCTVVVLAGVDTSQH
jgi:hypothetical protein